MEIKELRLRLLLLIVVVMHATINRIPNIVGRKIECGLL